MPSFPMCGDRSIVFNHGTGLQPVEHVRMRSLSQCEYSCLNLKGLLWVPLQQSNEWKPEASHKIELSYLSPMDCPPHPAHLQSKDFQI